MANDPVPQHKDHRDIAPAGPPPARDPPDNIIEGRYTDVREPSGVGRMALDALKWFGREALMPAAEKLIPQGAGEIGQVLYTGQGFVPYGPKMKPLAAEEEVQDPPAKEAVSDIKTGEAYPMDGNPGSRAQDNNSPASLYDAGYLMQLDRAARDGGDRDQGRTR